MKDIIDYSSLDESIKSTKALNDLKKYFGVKRWNDVQEEMKAKDVVSFICLCSFAGVEGYPVKAWYDSFHSVGSYDRDYKLAKDEHDAKPKDPSKVHMVFG